MRIIRLPTIIPKYRYRSAFIGLILASSIFVGAFTLVFALNRAGEDIFGVSDDILVYYNQEATTPFTSQVPEVLANSFSHIRGVIVANPEIFQPVVIKDKSAYIRGTNISNLLQLEGGQIIAGIIPSETDNFQVVIGSGLAKRIDVELGDEIIINSIKDEQVIPVEIIGIYNNPKGITNDELLVSLSLAKLIAGFDSTSVTHIRVKYDSSIISEKEILAKVLQTFTLTVNLDFGNGSDPIEDYQLIIRDNSKNILYQNLIQPIQSVELLQGLYSIVIRSNGTVIYEDEIDMNGHKIIEIDLNNYQFAYSSTIQYREQSISLVKFDLQDAQNNIILTGYSDGQGRIQTLLKKGNYTLILFEGPQPVVVNFNITGPLKQEINLDTLSTINILDITNNTIIPRNTFRVSIANISDAYSIYLDDQIQFVEISNNLRIKYLNVNLSDGIHVLELRRSINPVIILQSITFIVNSSISLLDISQLVSRAHYSPQTKLQVDLRGIDTQSLTIISGRLIEVSNTTGTIILPSTEGFYRLIIKGADILGNKIFRDWLFIIQKNATAGGWKEATDIPIVKTGDILELWVNQSTTNLQVDIGSVSNLSGEWIFQVPNLSIGIHIINFTDLSIDLNFSLSMEIVNNYKDLFSITNSTGSINLKDNSAFTTSYFEINYLRSGNYEEYWQVSINFGQGEFNIYSGQNISVPFNTPISTTIRILSKITGVIEITVVDFTDNVNATDLSQLKMGFPSIINNGKINLRDPSLNRLNISIVKDGEQYIPMNIDINTIQLSPGNYTAQITDNSLISYEWIFEILTWKTNTLVFNSRVSFSWGVLNSSIIRTSSGPQYINGKSAYVGFIESFNVDIYRNINTSEVEIIPTSLVEGTYQIRYENNTITEFPISETIITLDDTIQQNITLEITGINMNGVIRSRDFEIELGKQPSDFVLTLYNTTGDAISDVSVIIYLNETREIISFNLTGNDFSRILNFISQPARIVIQQGTKILQSKQYSQLKEELMLFLGTPTIEFQVLNQNLGKSEEDVFLTISSITNLENRLVIHSSSQLTLPVGKYLIEFNKGIYSGETLVTINRSRQLLLNFDILLISTTISVVNIPYNNIVNIKITHLVINTTITDQVTTQEASIPVLDFPQGIVSLSLSGSWGSQELQINLGVDPVIINIQSQKEEKLRNNKIEYRVVDKLSQLELGSSVGGDYLNQYLQGSLIIAQLILISELIIIVIIVISNIMGIFTVLTVESRKEILIMRNIGSSLPEVVFSVSKILILNTLTIAILGQLIGSTILSILVGKNFTVYFGHQFKMEFYNLQIFMTNLIMVFLVTILSSFGTIKREIYNGKEGILENP